MLLTGDRSRAGGFTLIELIVVLIIVALITVFAVPQILPAGSATALKTQAGEIATILRKTRSEAVRNNQEKWVVIDTEARRIEGDGITGVFEFPANAELILFTAAEEKVSDKRLRIRFYPDGSSSGGRISLVGKGREYHVDIEWFTGHVTVLN